jgi:hypothetical protein
MVFMAALTGRFNPQIKGEITSGGGGVMEHVARKRGKAGHGGLGVVEAGSWAAWAKRAAKPGGPGWCRFGLAGRPRLRDREASVLGRFAGKRKNQFLILIFGVTRILETESRSSWGQKGLGKIPKIL